MPDTYRLRQEVRGTGIGDVSIYFERTDGTDCPQILWEWRNRHPFLKLYECLVFDLYSHQSPYLDVQEGYGYGYGVDRWVRPNCELIVKAGFATPAAAIIAAFDFTYDNAIEQLSGATLYTDSAPAIIRPDGSSFTGNWRVSPGNGFTLWAAIDETTASDADYIFNQADGSLSDSICSVRLSNTSDPGMHTGHKVRARYARDGANASLIITLQQSGLGDIAERTVSLNSDSWTDYEFTLTEAEAAAITNYDNLLISFAVDDNGTNTTCKISWAEVEIPTGTVWGTFESSGGKFGSPDAGYRHDDDFISPITLTRGNTTDQTTIAGWVSTVDEGFFIFDDEDALAFGSVSSELSLTVGATTASGGTWSTTAWRAVIITHDPQTNTVNAYLDNVLVATVDAVAINAITAIRFKGAVSALYAYNYVFTEQQRTEFQSLTAPIDL